MTRAWVKGFTRQLRSHPPGGRPEITNFQELGPLSGGGGAMQSLRLPGWALTAVL